MNNRGITRVEIGVIAVIVALVFFIGFTLVSVQEEVDRGIEHVQKKGVKSVLMKVWEGSEIDSTQ